MMTIRELFAKPIDRRIEEVIKVDQADEATVEEELAEYVATASIKEHFRTVYKEMADAQAEPHEGIGVWVSGFFGSGKSSFAKILGYTIGGRRVGNRTASEIFGANVQDRRIVEILEFLNTRIPTEAVIFDVSMDQGVKTASERITEIMYKALLRELDYAQDFDLADLEIALEADGRLERFRERFEALHGKAWQTRRKLGLAVSEASAVLRDLDPKTYPAADSWARSLGEKGRADVTPNLLAERAFELASRRRPGRALLFVIDEVGQYVARSVEKMLDLQAVVQAFGVAGKNRVKARRAIAPCWIVVTSQEKLNEVVDALDSKKIELARLQDRFPIAVDLKQSDIAEVTSRRVLEKSPAGRQRLEALFDRNEGRLKTVSALERTGRVGALTRAGFVDLYPYLPYQIDLCIDIVAGLRLRRGAQRHIGGSNRTIIKQAQQMLVHPRTLLADEPIGTLVTLDRVYELLYAGNLLPTEVTREVDDIPKLLPANAMAVKVAKAIALLEAVDDLPRTPQNLAAVLHPAVDAEPVLDAVREALAALEAAQIVRETDEGYKLLTVQEKAWDTARRGIEAKPAHRNQILRDLFRQIFADPKVKTVRYKNLRPFKLGLSVNGDVVDADGHVPLNLLIAGDQEEWAERSREARATSNEKRNDIFWVVGLSEEIHRQVEELHRSREMIRAHEQLAAQGKLSAEDGASLAEEKLRAERTGRGLEAALTDAIRAGAGFFRGVQRDGSALGQSLSELTSRLLDWAIPDLYPKLELGTLTLRGDEPSVFLLAANLNGLPAVFYDGEQGRSLVVKQGGKFVPNVQAEICKEVLDYLKREHAYGNKVTGRSLELHFQGIGYGWERDILRLVLAVLLRGGAIEVTHQGRRYRSHAEPPSREPFTNQSAFRSASFAPRESLDLTLLANAARHYEAITGKEVDPDETAIAQAFQTLAAADRDLLVPVVTLLNAHGLPGAEEMAAHLESVQGVLVMPPDDCVRTLAGEGESYRTARTRASRLGEATRGDALAVVLRARRVLDGRWPAIERRGAEQTLADSARDLASRLRSDTFYDEIDAIRRASTALAAAYATLYERTHAERARVYAAALDAVKGLPEWSALEGDQAGRDAAAAPLVERAEALERLTDDADVCPTCRATVEQMESDVAAVGALQARTARRLQELAAPNERIERVSVAAVLGSRIESAEDVEAAITRLREHLLKLLAEGARIVLE